MICEEYFQCCVSWFWKLWSLKETGLHSCIGHLWFPGEYILKAAKCNLQLWPQIKVGHHQRSMLITLVLALRQVQGRTLSRSCDQDNAKKVPTELRLKMSTLGRVVVGGACCSNVNQITIKIMPLPHSNRLPFNFWFFGNEVALKVAVSKICHDIIICLLSPSETKLFKASIMT